jgi:hypothetical protein
MYGTRYIRIWISTERGGGTYRERARKVGEKKEGRVKEETRQGRNYHTKEAGKWRK